MKLAAILDNVRSVHNVGSIFRTADAAGFERVFCCGITPGPLDRFKRVRADFAKVALGAEKTVAWEAGEKTADVITRLKRDGWKVFVIEQDARSVPYHAIEKLTQPIALILGAEVDGVSREALDLADGILEIPMHGSKESLNVAVAFGVVAFELRRANKPV